MLPSLPLDLLSAQFGDRLKKDMPMGHFTTAHVGGPADALVAVSSADDLAQTAIFLWERDVPFLVLGGGSNVLVSDAGVRGVVILNQAKDFRFEVQPEMPQVWAESGANFGLIARQAATRGWSGLEWAAGIPGTLGGAVIGNAGAHGSDMATNLRMADILHLPLKKPTGATGQPEQPHRDQNTVKQMGYAYRRSQYKQLWRSHPKAIVLSAILGLTYSTPEAVREKMTEYSEYRHKTQPAGASMGSIFKNPPGHYAARLIEAVGLKGYAAGEAEISRQHANFFINLGKATASDFYRLIRIAQEKVLEKFEIVLELEIELIGEW